MSILELVIAIVIMCAVTAVTGIFTIYLNNWLDKLDDFIEKLRKG